jgi:hypothetical protein
MKKHIEREHLVSKIKMLTGLEFEIIDDKLQLNAGQLSMSELDRLVKYCNRVGLEYNLESNLIFTIQ